MTGPANKPWSVYMVRCGSGSLYTGISNDVAKRFEAHQQGRGAKYLRGRGILRLVFELEVGDMGSAMRLERIIKRWSKTRKERLIAAPDLMIPILVKRNPSSL